MGKPVRRLRALLLEKLEDEDTGKSTSPMFLKLLDSGLCACKDLPEPFRQVPDWSADARNVRTLNGCRELAATNCRGGT